MSNLSTEDTIIGTSPVVRADLLLAETDRSFESDPSLLERCRAFFRSFGEQMSSFELSRQIYG